ncbi:MAG: hypothetical protein KC481_08950 [Acidimicrobiaceae bacterium]|jgi:hypothetical protein|nr:hypothetical protein [Acidimicrobiaceae bacterium]MBT6443824.1 hypothetical protein [Acidimicrobiaceae bacterium]MCH9805626.1 hypothetical protein [bacterium]MCO4833775.1 hypothetical protein [Acidimicrobiaceae bacterium]MDG1087665.1 hypothetical protein [Acidimicrobiales bacterium]
MVAVLVGALLIALTGGGLVWLGRGMEAGQLNPNMGHMTARNTTPASWRKMQTTVGRSLVSCGRMWIAAAVAALAYAPLGVALLVVATGVLVVQVAMASALLEPAG